MLSVALRVAASADSNAYSTWYTPLHRTLMALSLLYRCLDVCTPILVMARIPCMIMYVVSMCFWAQKGHCVL